LPQELVKFTEQFGFAEGQIGVQENLLGYAAAASKVVTGKIYQSYLLGT